MNQTFGDLAETEICGARQPSPSAATAEHHRPDR
jgi:hypothetical protein